MLHPSDLGLNVRGDAWRTGQWETISRLASSDKRILLFEGPPGSGKSLVARAVASLLDLRTHYLTGTKQLQQQYGKDGVPTAIGRPNFECAIEDVGADAAICTVGGRCEHAGRKGLPGCPYYDQKRVAEKSREAVFNYAVWLPWVNQTGFQGPELLVADEAHTLKDHVRSFAQVSLSNVAMGKLGLNATEPKSTDFGDWRAWAKGNLPSVAHRWRVLEGHPPEPGDPAAVRYAHSVHAVFEALKAISHADDDDWIVQSTPFGHDFKPVWVHALVPPLVLKHASEKVLLMSATILNKEVYCQLHGINPDDTEWVQLGSSFARSRRPLHYNPAERARRGEDQRALTDAVRAAVSRHPDDRVLVHTVSNWLAADVAAALRAADSGARDIITHSAKDRVDALNRFSATAGAVLVSPSMHTGVDLPDDLLRAQVIARLPFPDMGDPLIKAQMKNATRDNPLDKGNIAYTYDTAAALVQTYGRIMRSEDDHGVTYLLDPAWKWFRHAARNFLPRWFTEAVVGGGGSSGSRFELLG